MERLVQPAAFRGPASARQRAIVGRESSARPIRELEIYRHSTIYTRRFRLALEKCDSWSKTVFSFLLHGARPTQHEQAATSGKATARGEIGASRTWDQCAPVQHCSRSCPLRGYQMAKRCQAQALPQPAPPASPARHLARCPSPPSSPGRASGPLVPLAIASWR
jgi:hypothetical protein